MSDFPIPLSWDRAGLEAVGFKGFVPLVSLDLLSLPARRGVYVVLRPGDGMPAFLESSPIARRAPYPVETLKAKWVPDQPVIYVGKADPVDGLLGRLGDYSKKSSSHTGGRAIWQLADADTLLVAWAETPDHVAESVEKTFLRAFKLRNGKYPFANWRL